MTSLWRSARRPPQTSALSEKAGDSEEMREWRSWQTRRSKCSSTCFGWRLGRGQANAQACAQAPLSSLILSGLISCQERESLNSVVYKATNHRLISDFASERLTAFAHSPKTINPWPARTISKAFPMDRIHADEWRSAVTRSLVGKQQVFLSVVAKEALGRGYHDMSRDDWRHLAGLMKGAGWRSRSVQGAQVWAPVQPQLI
jgi:hypothetical protein